MNNIINIIKKHKIISTILAVAIVFWIIQGKHITNYNHASEIEQSIYNQDYRTAYMLNNKYFSKSTDDEGIKYYNMYNIRITACMLGADDGYEEVREKIKNMNKNS